MSNEEVKVIEQKEVSKKNIIQIARRAYQLQCEVNEKTSELNELKIKIHEYLEKFELTMLRVEREVDENESAHDKARHINIKQIIRTSITWDVNKLKEKLDKQTFKKVTTSTYTITDFDKFKELMKKYNVPSKEVLELIDVNHTVNNKAVEQALEIGDILKDDIIDCYEVKVVKALQIRNE